MCCNCCCVVTFWRSSLGNKLLLFNTAWLTTACTHSLNTQIRYTYIQSNFTTKINNKHKSQIHHNCDLYSSKYSSLPIQTSKSHNFNSMALIKKFFLDPSSSCNKILWSDRSGAGIYFSYKLVKSYINLLYKPVKKLLPVVRIVARPAVYISSLWALLLGSKVFSQFLHNLEDLRAQ